MKKLLILSILFLFSCSEKQPYSFPPGSNWKHHKSNGITIFHKGGLEKKRAEKLTKSWTKAFKGSKFFLEKQGNYYSIIVPNFPKKNITKEFEKDLTNVVVGTSKEVFDGQFLEIQILDKEKKPLIKVMSGTKREKREKIPLIFNIDLLS